ncbi:MAG TPA: hypothetical protein VFX70_07075 [Mycobacteriales bacterium]|nr:hypothetical protein [Mycobacteriales bacterium]
MLGTSPGRGGGNVVYAGASSGSLRFGSSTCAVRNGALVSFSAPDGRVDAKPKSKLTLSQAAGQWTAAFVPDTTDTAHSYTRTGAASISAARRGGAWVITLSGTTLAGTTGKHPTLTLDGLLTCGRLT